MKLRVQHLALSLMLSASAPLVPAINVMDLKSEQLLFAAGDLKDTLTLTQNQQTLWQQSTAKANTLLRARQKRRTALQAEVTAKLGDPKVELRELGTAIDQEADLAAAEDKQLRELWLSVNDALDDQQRAKVTQAMMSQLERADHPNEAGGRREGGPPEGGKHGGKRGGMGGMGGQRPQQ
jgi:hypothetical protein